MITGSSAQIVCGIFIAVVYIKLYGFFCPFKEDDDDVLQEMAQFQVFITLFISLLIRDGTHCTNARLLPFCHVTHPFSNM